MTHGWPGSIFELLKVVGPLTDPTAHGRSAEDAFDLVLPSMPGYGFSGRPQTTGWGTARIAGAWDVLMRRLGYEHYVSQGGDWGSVVSDAMASGYDDTRRFPAPAGLLGIHVNMPRPCRRRSRRRSPTATRRRRDYPRRRKSPTKA